MGTLQDPEGYATALWFPMNAAPMVDKDPRRCTAGAKRQLVARRRREGLSKGEYGFGRWDRCNKGVKNVTHLLLLKQQVNSKLRFHQQGN
jgi:hypothetical protein